MPPFDACSGSDRSMNEIVLAIDKFALRYVQPKPGRTLIAGSRVYKTRTDRRSAYPDAIGVDMQPGDGVDRVLDLEQEIPSDIGKFDHIECLSVLEHARRPWLIAENLQRVMLPGATIHLAVPFVWRVHAYPSDYFRFTAEGVRTLFRDIDWRKLLYVHHQITKDSEIPNTRVNDHQYFARTEVAGFGVRA